MDNGSDLLMLQGVMSFCADCGAECLFVPVEHAAEYCCTSCDAAVFLLEVVDNAVPRRTKDRVA